MSKPERKELQYVLEICNGLASRTELETCLPWLRGNRFNQALEMGFLEPAPLGSPGRWQEPVYRAGKNL